MAASVLLQSLGNASLRININKTQRQLTTAICIYLASKSRFKVKPIALNTFVKFSSSNTSSTQTQISHVRSQLAHLRPPSNVEKLNLALYLLTAINKHGSKIALIDPANDRSMTYSELEVTSRRMARALVRQGVCAGDVVSVIAPNSIEWVVSYLAIVMIGATLTAVNPTSTARELSYFFKLTKTKYVLTTPYVLKPIVDAVESLQTSIKIIIFGKADGFLSYDDLLASSSETYDVIAPTSGRSDVAILFNSSGTTGLPKSVMLSHYAVISNIEQMRYNDTMPVLFPMFHIGGGTICVPVGLMSGTTLIMVPTFDLVKYLGWIEKYRITKLSLPPPVLLLFAKHAIIDKFDLSTVVDVLTGGAPVSGSVAEQALTRIKVNSYILVYGMTECGVVTASPRNGWKFHTCGVPIHDNELKIIDLETNEIVKHGKSGEICLKGPQLTNGYLGNDDATHGLLVDGWAHSGDIGYLDDDNQLIVTDRLKELIKYKGFQVAPAELEALLLTHAAVQDTAVVGVSNKEAGEVPRAFVVLKPNVTAVTQDDLVKFVSENAAPYKRLRGGVEFCREIPKSPSGKILRRVLRDEYHKNI